MTELSTKKLEAALAQLKKATVLVSPSELERDGGIQRFEYCIELSWKLCRRFLKMQGIDIQTPKDTFRAMGKYANLNDVDLWLEFLLARNYSSHTYEAATAVWVWNCAIGFVGECEKLLDLLKSATVPKA